jgi:hypothetical protein
MVKFFYALILITGCLVSSAKANENVADSTQQAKRPVLIKLNTQYHHNLSNGTIQLQSLRPGLMLFLANKNFIEFRVNDMVLFRDPNNLESQALYGFDFKIQYNINLLKKNEKFSPYIGVFYYLNPYFIRYTEINSGKVTHHRGLEAEIGFGLAPGLLYKASDKIYLNFSMPYAFDRAFQSINLFFGLGFRL